MRFCTVHTHSTLCDGRNTLPEMAEAAYQAGAVSFGASGHSPTPIPHDVGGVLPDLTEYRTEVLRLREVYAGRMEVLLGIELDSCSELEPEGFDYWIGSVHNLFQSAGRYHPVDWDWEKLLRGAEEMFGGDFFALIRGYYREVARMAARKPTILGHIDLITKFNEDGALFDEADPRYRDAALEALHAADPAETVLEINTGAVARGFRTVPYPARFLLEEWRTMGGRIVLTADAHQAENIVFGYGDAAELAGAAGFREHWLLRRSGWEAEPLA